MMKSRFIVVLALLLGVSFTAQAANVGQWSGSSRSWNNDNFTNINTSVTGAGHTIEVDGGISAAGLANDDAFVIGEGTGTMTVGEAADLKNWILGGGRLLLFTDSGGPDNNNTILSLLGSAMSFGGSPSGTAFSAGTFVDGPFANLNGQNLSTSPGVAVTGGTSVAGSYVQYEQMGAGYIITFADRSDHNIFANSANFDLIHNILGTTPVPEPSTYLMFGLGLLGLSFLRRRKQA